MLGVFGNALTANDKYPVRDCENLSSPFQMQGSLKPKIFLIVLFHFWILHQILNILQEKDDRHSHFISEITDCERLG